MTNQPGTFDTSATMPFAPRPLTPAEIDRLRREGREFQEQYAEIRAAALVDRTTREA